MEGYQIMKPLRTCAICHTEYDYCSSCPDKMRDPVWKNSFCSMNCKKIYDTCVGFSLKEISPESAYKTLSSCDLSKQDTYSESTRKIIKEILALSPQSKPFAKPFKEPPKEFKK